MMIASTLLSPAITGAEELDFKIVATTDVHGNFFPFDFIKKTEGEGSLARVSSRIKFLREKYGKDRVILLDNGDILQGQPTAYYYNYIDTLRRHPVAEMLNYIGYDAQTIGNHDVETGHDVYDRYRKDLSTIPLLAANVIDTRTNEPYFTPYTIIEREGVRFAVLGLITPAVPSWLPEKLWSNLRFEDMLESARKWVGIIKEKENPDILIGLFHSGNDSSVITGNVRENASQLVAEKIKDFDVVFSGHDHKVFKSQNNDNLATLILNPANNADNLAEVDIKVVKKDGKLIEKFVDGEIVDLKAYQPDPSFLDKFKGVNDSIYSFVSEVIGTAEGDFYERDAYFGPSAFMQLLHELQLEISGADISFAAPLSFDAVINEGPLTMSDMFTLYKYENMLYTMLLSGKEIKNYLEKSYSIWTTEMKSPEDHLLLFSDTKTGSQKGGYSELKYPSYNFDSAFGINYTVDVTKPQGEKIEILSMADGTPFDENKLYKVAINSYRGNGGGNLLTEGAGINKEELKTRVIDSTEKDLRYYLIQKLKNRAVISPTITDNWRFIPEDITTPAAERDRKILFGD